MNSAKGDPNALMVGGMVMVGGMILQQSPVNLRMVTPIARLTSEWEVIVVPAASPHKTMADLVKALKANPGNVSWGGGSAGGTDHILAGLIAKAVGVDPGEGELRRLQGRRRSARRHHRRPRDRGHLGHRRIRARRSRRARCARWRCPRRRRVDGIPSLKEQGIDVELANWRGVCGRPRHHASRSATSSSRLVGEGDQDPGLEETLKKLGWTGVLLAGDAVSRRSSTRTQARRRHHRDARRSRRSSAPPAVRGQGGLHAALPAEIALSAGVLVLGIGVAIGTALLPSEGGYARIGPNFMPAVVGGGLIVIGVWLLYEAFAGGWRDMPDDSPAAAASMRSTRPRSCG